jgi:KDO2-lipid IV(A) lauroyltransferase
VKVRHALEALGFWLLLGAARVLPRRALLRVGSLAGILGFALDARHRRIAAANLELAFGGTLDTRARARLQRACWRHFGRITLESLRFPRLDAAAAEGLVHLEGIDLVRAAYARGKGVLLFSGHYGHWELAALVQGYLGMPLTLVARPLDNPVLERMLARLRTGSGNVVVHKRSAIREMLQTLASGGGVAIVIDQDAREAGVFVPFLGRLASTTPTLATLALRTGAAVIPVFCVPQPEGTYRIIYGPLCEVKSTGDRAKDVARITAECTAVLEQWVRRHPEYWLWMHRRWKTAPPGAADSRSKRA